MNYNRKRWLSIAMAMILSVVLFSFTAFAESSAARVWFTGAKVVQPGESLFLQLRVEGSSLQAVQGTLDYDTDLLSLEQITKAEDDGETDEWMITCTGNTFKAFDYDLDTPLTQENVLLNIVFYVKKPVSTDTTIITCRDLRIDEGNGLRSLPPVMHELKVDGFSGADAALRSLQAEGAVLKPAFDPDVLYYEVTVPEDMERLKLLAEPEKENASLDIVDQPLRKGETTSLWVNVTAESGEVRTYVVDVHRGTVKNDGNVTILGKSDDNDLKALYVGGFDVLPTFQKDVTSYKVELPYDIKAITVEGIAVDKAASVEIQGASMPEPGSKQTVSIICTAENGSSKQYTVELHRAAKPSAASLSVWRLILWGAIVVAICAGIGSAAGILCYKGRKAHRNQEK